MPCCGTEHLKAEIDTLVTSSWLGSTSAQDLVGNRTTMGLINKPCDSIHTTSYALDLVLVLALGKKGYGQINFVLS